MGNSSRALCEHSGTHADTQHSVGRVGGLLETPADKKPNWASFSYGIEACNPKGNNDLGDVMTRVHVVGDRGIRNGLKCEGVHCIGAS
jgi:hypothetical protein